MNTKVVVRPVTEDDAESLGLVHAACWHETYDQLLSQAALSQLRPQRLAALWRRFTSQGAQYRQNVVLVDGAIVGFAGSGPTRDEDKPTPRELYFLYLLEANHGSGVGQQLFDSVVDPGASSLWVAADSPRAHAFYARNGYTADGHDRIEEVLGEKLHEVRLVR